MLDMFLSTSNTASLINLKALTITVIGPIPVNILPTADFRPKAMAWLLDAPASSAVSIVFIAFPVSIAPPIIGILDIAPNILLRRPNAASSSFIALSCSFVYSYSLEDVSPLIFKTILDSLNSSDVILLVPSA